MKMKSPSRLQNDSMRVDLSHAIEKLHLVIVGEITRGQASLDNSGVSDR